MKRTKKILALMLSFIMLTLPFPIAGAVASEPFSSSVPSNAIHIKTAAQLAGIGGTQSMGKYYVLDNDISLDVAWTPIQDFRGALDGQGYSVNNLHMNIANTGNNPINVGLFGKIKESVIIKNLRVNIGSQGISVSSGVAEANAGGLIGYCGSAGSVTIENCVVKGDIPDAATSFSSLSTNVGGMVGYYDGSGNGDLTIKDCSVTGNISALEKAGGLIGLGKAGRVITIENCCFDGVAYAGSPSPNTGVAGGLVGECNSFGATIVIEKCYATGRVAGLGFAGGLLGNIYGGNITVSDCYTTGDVSTWFTAGGLIGKCQGAMIENCYTTGDIEATPSWSGPATHVGGLIGEKNNTVIKNCYRLSSQIIDGNAIEDCGEPLTDSQMKSASSFLGWDFDSVWGYKNGTNNNYPVLRAFAGIGAAVSSVALDKTSTTIMIGDKESLTVTVYPAYATNKAVTWNSSDPSVADVDSDGLVTGGAKGEAVITVTTVDGGKTASCTVIVGDSGIDYTAVDDIVIVGTINGTKDDNFFINLTAETITIPSAYVCLAYSIDDGRKWKPLKRDIFSADSFPKLLNKNFTLQLSDKLADKKTKKPPDDATIISFAQINKRAPLPKLSANYAIGADATGETAGTWLLARKVLPPGLELVYSPSMSKKELKKLLIDESMKEGLLIAEADTSKKKPNEQGFGRFRGKNGTKNGIAVKPLISAKPEKSVYLYKVAAVKVSEAEYTAASKTKRVSVKGQGKAPAYRVKKGVIKVRAGTSLYLDGKLTAYTAKADVSVSGFTGKVELWLNATANKPASKKQELSV